jgi:hypothetical protein
MCQFQAQSAIFDFVEMDVLNQRRVGSADKASGCTAPLLAAEFIVQ